MSILVWLSLRIVVASGEWRVASGEWRVAEYKNSFSNKTLLIKI
ncbi:hypothetical protein [Photobacterium iliopiscarium]|nr:hypothetical protein [Photobacterium iliopiscarium]